MIFFVNDVITSFTPKSHRYSSTVNPQSVMKSFFGSHKSGCNKPFLAVKHLSTMLPGNEYETKENPPPVIIPSLSLLCGFCSLSTAFYVGSMKKTLQLLYTSR